MREHSTPALVEIPASANLSDVVFRRADEEPGTVIMRRKSAGDGGWRDVTARAFRDEVMALAKGLIAAGIQAGDRVALMSRTRYEWTLIDYAIWSAGAVTVPIYETSSAEQVEWIIGDSGARAVFAETAAHETTIASARAQLPHLELTWRIEGDAAKGDGEALREVSERGGVVSDEQVAAQRQGVTAGDLATIVYTSGTTGRPKGCALTHANLLADVRNAIEAVPEIFGIRDGSTLLFLPLAHGFARIIEVGCLEAGVVLGHTPAIKDLVADLASFQPTFILAVPRVFEKVFNTAQQQASKSPVKKRIFSMATDTAIAHSRALDAREHGQASSDTGLKIRHTLFDRLVYSKLRQAVGGQVKYAVSGGAALGERLGHFFRGAGITILEGYGMTELTAAATVNRPNRNRIGTVGLPLPGASVRIADDGEILISGPMAFSGYWNNEAATKEILEDGWIHSGDIGSLTDEGFLQITGRKKELIVTAGGKNVAPAVLEDRLRAHPLISHCMVVGDGRPFVAALVTLDEEMLPHWKEQHGKPAEATPTDLREDPDLLAGIQEAVDDANKAVSKAEGIRRFRVLPTDFTEAGGQLTPSLKLRRAVVAKECAADIDALYS